MVLPVVVVEEDQSRAAVILFGDLIASGEEEIRQDPFCPSSRTELHGDGNVIGGNSRLLPGGSMISLHRGAQGRPRLLSSGTISVVVVAK